MRALLFCLLSLLPTLFYAQNKTARFDIITTDDGLPENTVNAILQDSRGFLWLGTQQGLVRYDGYEMKVFDIDFESKLGFREVMPISIIEDPAGDIWFRHIEGQIFRLDQETEKVYLIYHIGRMPNGMSSDLFLGPDSTIWYTDVGIYQFPWKQDIDSLKENQIITIDDALAQPNKFHKLGADPQGTVWATSTRGLFRWNKGERTFDHYQSKRDTTIIPDNFYNDLTFDKNGTIWMSSGGAGLINFDPSTASFKHYLHDPNNPNSVLRDAIIPIFMDSRGILWIMHSFGTPPPAIQWFDPQTEQFHLLDITIDDPYESLGSAIMFRGSKETRSGSVLLGTWLGGMIKYNPERSTFNWLQHDQVEVNSLSHNSTSGIIEDDQGMIWVATHKGLDQYNRRTLEVSHYKYESSDPSLFFHSVMDAVFQDIEGRFWVGSRGGFLQFNPETGQFTTVADTLSVRAITQSESSGLLWLSTLNHGLVRYNPKSKQFKSYQRTGDLKTGPYSNRIRKAIIDKEGRIWITFNGGEQPQRFDPQTEKFESFEAIHGSDITLDEKGNIWTNYEGLRYIDLKNLNYKQYDQLMDYQPRSILADDKGRIWGAGQNGLICFDPISQNFERYTTSDGLVTNRIVSKHITKSSTGELFFSSPMGLLHFHPDSLVSDGISPKIELTQLDISGQAIEEIGGDSPLQKQIGLTQKIELSHTQNNLTFHYAALHFKNPSANQYQVMLEGKDTDWRTMGGFRQVDYTNLAPGRYTFRVRASNNRGIWTTPEEDLALQVRILPPWWLTGWAIALFSLAGLVLLFYIYRYFLNRQLALAELKKIKELDEVKSKLYTNITHEFRTPLTVIQGMNQKTKEQAEDLQVKEIVANTEVVHRNSAQLLTLVNQMLDLQKLESGSLTINSIQGDILPYLSYILEPFQSHASAKGIRLHILSSSSQIVMDYDPERILSIVSNLLSNAIKFTPSGGDVYVTIRKEVNSPEQLSIEVKDTGIGIPPEKLDKVFDRFYQIDDTTTRPAEGTGIGLALTKELVHLLKGKISVESQLQKGSTFLIQLPITRLAPLQQTETLTGINGNSDGFLTHNGEIPLKPSPKKSAEKDRPLVLLVEDNKDMLAYLQSCLQNHYHLQTATNGAEGIQYAIANTPDLIVSDVMMPEKDGLELTRTLKTDPRTSHIPIVLLTAKADIASKISGLEIGADAYLPKPFHPKELEVRLRKLIEIRKTLQQKYAESEFFANLSQKPEKTLSLDEIFLKRAYQTVEKNYEDEEFGIKELMTELNVSRTQLHRKLKALTNHSTSEFIRKIRLAKAKELLLTTDLNVSEIGYRVGFKSSGYFTQAFTNAFGQSPTSFRKSL